MLCGCVCVIIFTLFHCLSDLSCCECDVISLYFTCCSVNVFVCILCCVLDRVCELFGETIHNVFGCGSILMLNVMGVFSVGGGALLDRPCMVFQRMCVLCM